MKFHDRSQHVTIRIASNNVPATVRLQSAGLRALERMAQIDKGHAAQVHGLPSMIVHEDSTAAGKRTNAALGVRAFHHRKLKPTRHFVKYRLYV